MTTTTDYQQKELSPSRQKIADRQEAVALLTHKGDSVRAIARILGITERTVLRDRVVLGIAQEAPTPVTDEQIAIAELLFEDECPFTEIARTLDCSINWVSKHFAGRPHPRVSNPLGKHHRGLAERLGLTVL